MSAEEIEELRDIAAEMAIADPRAIPVFRRMEHELAEAQEREAAARRAKRLTAEALI